MSEDDLHKVILEIQGAWCDDCGEDTNHCNCMATCLHHQDYKPGLGDPTEACAGCWQARSKYIESVLVNGRVMWLQAALSVRVPPLIVAADEIGNKRRCFNAGVVAMEDAIQQLINNIEEN